MLKRTVLLLLVILYPFIGHPQNGGSQSKLYENFVNNKATSILPDFSYAGYHHGEKGISVPKLKVFDVRKYGAIPDDSLSDKKAIESTIRAAEANGGGIVFFPKGRFLINEDGDARNSIRISSDNIVLMGSGSGAGGTELFMKNPMVPADTTKMWTAPAMFVMGSTTSKKSVGMVKSGAAVGAFKIIVHTPDLEAGDCIELYMISTNPALLKAELGDHQAEKEWTSLLNKGTLVRVVHQVKAIDKDTVTLQEPLTYNIDPDDKWTVFKIHCAQEIGITRIAFVGNWKQKFVHHRSWKDDSGYTMIKAGQIANSWISDCRFTDVNVATSINLAANISVLSCSITGNGGHEAITNSGGTNILFANIRDSASQFHSVGVADGAMNTVIWHVTYPSSTSFESHSSQPRNTLLDNVEGGLQYNRGGGAAENMPNHMQNLVLWNYKQTGKAYDQFRFWPDKPWYWRIPYPTIVGFHGADTHFKTSELKYEESTGAAVQPESLYEAQLKLRLKKNPEWLVQLKNSDESK